MLACILSGAALRHRKVRMRSSSSSSPLSCSISRAAASMSACERLVCARTQSSAGHPASPAGSPMGEHTDPPPGGPCWIPAWLIRRARSRQARCACSCLTAPWSPCAAPARPPPPRPAASAPRPPLRSCSAMRSRPQGPGVHPDQADNRACTQLLQSGAAVLLLSRVSSRSHLKIIGRLTPGMLPLPLEA